MHYGRRKTLADQLPLVDLIEMVKGLDEEPVADKLGRCPECKEEGVHLTVNEEGYWCQNCGRAGDSVDYVAWYLDVEDAFVEELFTLILRFGPTGKWAEPTRGPR